MFPFAQERAARRSDKAECRRPIDSLGPSLGRQLQEDALCMRFDSFRSDTQLASDPFVGQPIAHEANDHAFANREESACMLHSAQFLCGNAPDFFGETP
jgi:hypothetical protein